MDFLADECCDRAFQQALRAEGHDVRAVADVAKGGEDPDVIRLALDQNRILLTEDKDFGQLVYASGARTVGVILLRYDRPRLRAAVVTALLDLTRSHAAKIPGHFIVIEPGRIRIASPPALGP